jgi:catechol 2,3-dioxygenase-like lactoylglutathione lyase family enzyme
MLAAARLMLIHQSDAGRQCATIKEIVMLKNTDVMATIGVKNLDAARTFYEGTLGLKPDTFEEPGAIAYKSANSNLLVYESRFAGTNKATAATWEVSDIEQEVRDLKIKGVTFEKYDLPGMTRMGDLHVSGETKAAWFKDPDGNILAIVGR